MDTTPLKRAAQKVGGVAALARRLGESVQTVSNWLARGEPPASKAAAIEAISGVSRRDLRAKDWHDYWPELEVNAAANSQAATQPAAAR